jgi:putative DNA primase/helicase
MTPVETLVSALESERKQVRSAGRGKWEARCPAHEDRSASLSIGEGDDGRVLLCCHAGCATEDVVAALGIGMADLFPRKPANRRSGGDRTRRTAKAWLNLDMACEAFRVGIAAKEGGAVEANRWMYPDERGADVGVVVRFDLPTPAGEKTRKSFRPLHWTATGWVRGDPNGLWPLYRLLTLAGAKRVYVCEGEKATDAAVACGLTATTSAHGAKSAAKTDWKPLANIPEIIIVPDNDDAGEKYARDVAALLWVVNPSAVVKVIRLADLVDEGFPKGGDFADFSSEFRDGQDAGEIRAEVEALADRAEATAPIAPLQTPRVPESGPVLVKLSDVAPAPVRWLWPHRIAIGKVTMIAGDPGLGKSFLTLDMASRVSTGTPWPDCPTTPNPIGGVVLLNCEDDLADTIRPRLGKAGANCFRIVALAGVRTVNSETGETATRAFSLDRDLPRLEAAIAATPNCRLVVIDPVTACLGETDSHKNADIRALLSPLGEMAARTGVAIVCVSHLNKGSGPAMYRTMGSLAFVAAARAAFAVTKDKDDATGTRRLVLPVKNNLGPDNSGLAYALVDGRVVWESDPVTVTADDALAPAGDGNPGPEPEALKEATAWLRELLTSSPMLAADMKKHARDCAISNRTLDRAKREARVESYRPIIPGPWYWRLPRSTLPTGPNAFTYSDLGDLGNVAETNRSCLDERSQGCQDILSGNLGPNGVSANGILDSHSSPKKARRITAVEAGMRMPNSSNEGGEE